MLLLFYLLDNLTKIIFVSLLFTELLQVVPFSNLLENFVTLNLVVFRLVVILIIRNSIIGGGILSY